MTYQQAFCGKVEQSEFVQCADLQTGVTQGLIPVFWRDLVTRRAKTQNFRFIGLSETEAASTATHTVTDVGGTSYNVPFNSSFTDGSHGTRVFEIESVRVTRRRISPHFWEVVVSRTGSEYWVNNNKIISGPDWAFG